MTRNASTVLEKMKTLNCVVLSFTSNRHNQTFQGTNDRLFFNLWVTNGYSLISSIRIFLSSSFLFTVPRLSMRIDIFVNITREKFVSFVKYYNEYKFNSP